MASSVSEIVQEPNNITFPSKLKYVIKMYGKTLTNLDSRLHDESVREAIHSNLDIVYYSKIKARSAAKNRRKKKSHRIKPNHAIVIKIEVLQYKIFKGQLC